ncbi:hypothetical protein QYF36_010182 [Acer negundo]|nr:hypothetical protein QYF36_010182 [Acer negundo]
MDLITTTIVNHPKAEKEEEEEETKIWSSSSCFRSSLLSSSPPLPAIAAVVVVPVASDRRHCFWSSPLSLLGCWENILDSYDNWLSGTDSKGEAGAYVSNMDDVGDIGST